MKKIVPSLLMASFLLGSIASPGLAAEQSGADNSTLNVQVTTSNTYDNYSENLPYVSNATVPGEFIRHAQLALEETQDLTSTDDARRNRALEAEYNITLEPSDHWSVRYPSYTPEDTLKQLGYYHVNANRNTLIMYAIRKDDWQPYRAYQAKETPLYFEIVDGKFEYSKIYWANMLRRAILNNIEVSNEYNEYYGSVYLTPEIREFLKTSFQLEIQEYTGKLNAAKGIMPYVSHLNHTEELAKENNLPMADEGFINSPYNDPRVLSEGKFTEGNLERYNLKTANEALKNAGENPTLENISAAEKQIATVTNDESKSELIGKLEELKSKATLELAIKAVDQASTSKSAADIQSALELVTALTAGDEKTNLQNRLGSLLVQSPVGDGANNL